MDFVGRLISSKGWSYFWMTWAFLFMVLDAVTGSVGFAIFQGLMFLFFLWDYRKKVNGTHTGYNLYHGDKV